MDVQITWWIVALAVASFLGGIGLYLWAVRRPRARFIQSTNHVAWLLVALCPTLLLFSLFPDSTADGTVVGFTLSGALAAFVLIWWWGSREGAQRLQQDQDVEALRAEVAELRRQAGATGQAVGEREDAPLPDGREWRYRVRGRRGREVVVLTGDLRHVQVADVWVSSENTNMQMARFYERSVSALVRYYGAERDEAGDPVEDVVADDLAACMQRMDKEVVQPGMVLATTAGALERTNHVRRVYHVASVEGQPGAGYRPVRQLGECVRNALSRFDASDEAADGASSILFPLMGAGVARGDASRIAAEVVGAVSDHLHGQAGTRVRRVYLLAHQRHDLEQWVAAAERCDLLEPIGGSAEALLDAGRPRRAQETVPATTG